MATLKKLPQSAPNMKAAPRTHHAGMSPATTVSPSTPRVYAGRPRMGSNAHADPCPPAACYEARTPQLASPAACARSVRMSAINPREALLDARRIVVKIGTKSITAGAQGRFALVARQVAKL